MHPRITGQRIRNRQKVSDKDFTDWLLQADNEEMEEVLDESYKRGLATVKKEINEIVTDEFRQERAKLNKERDEILTTIASLTEATKRLDDL